AAVHRECARDDRRRRMADALPSTALNRAVAERLLAQLPELTVADERRLRARIRAARARRAGEDEWARIADDVERARAVHAARVVRKPAVAYPPELPISQRASEIAAAIRAHPVVIVSGETGSGKTTQLPKICLEAGRGERGL